jgi:hypothetical protein
MIAGLKLFFTQSRVLLVLGCIGMFVLLLTYTLWKTADIIARGGRAEGSIQTNKAGESDADRASEGINAADACERGGRMWDLRTGKCRDRPAASVPKPE